MQWAIPDFDDVMDWPIRAQLQFLLVVMTVVQLVAAWWWLQPLHEVLKESESRTHQHSRTVQLQQVKLQSFTEELLPISDLSMRYRAMMRQFPEQSELSSLLSQINALGKKHHLTFIHFGWGKRERRDYLATIPIHIELTGEFHDIGRFSEALAALPVMVTIQRFALQALNKSRDISVKMIALTYQMDQDVTLNNELFDSLDIAPTMAQRVNTTPSSIIRYHGAMRRSPFYENREKSKAVIKNTSCIQDMPAATTPPVSRQMLSRIKVKGVLLMRDQYVGWLQPAGSTLIKVYKGEKLGPHHGEIVQINREGLVVKEFKVGADGCWFESLFAMSING